MRDVSSKQFLDGIKALLPEIRARAAQTERQGAVSDEIVERRKLQSPDVVRAYEQDVSRLRQRLIGKGANLLSFVCAQGAEHSIGLAAGDHHPVAIPGVVLKSNVLIHGGEDLPEDFDTEPGRLVIVQLLKRREKISDQSQ